MQDSGPCPLVVIDEDTQKKKKKNVMNLLAQLMERRPFRCWFMLGMQMMWLNKPLNPWCVDCWNCVCVKYAIKFVSILVSLRPALLLGGGRHFESTPLCAAADNRNWRCVQSYDGIATAEADGGQDPEMGIYLYRLNKKGAKTKSVQCWSEEKSIGTMPSSQLHPLNHFSTLDAISCFSAHFGSVDE